MDVLGRLLALPGTDAPEFLARKFTDFARFWLIASFAHLLVTYAGGIWTLEFGRFELLLLAMGLANVLAFTTGRWTAALCLAACVMAGAAVATFPGTPNHLYLNVVMLVVAAIGSSEPQMRSHALGAARWMLALVIFWAGLNKALYGAYFRGEYLAYLVSRKPGMRDFLSLFAPPEEIRRLAALGHPGPGDGPYLIDAPLVVLASNIAWTVEVGAALALFHPRTRALGAITIVVLIALIEAGALELVFGIFSFYLCTLFAPGDLNRRLSPLLLSAFGLVLLLSQIFPDRGFN